MSYNPYGQPQQQGQPGQYVVYVPAGQQYIPGQQYGGGQQQYIGGPPAYGMAPPPYQMAAGPGPNVTYAAPAGAIAAQVSCGCLLSSASDRKGAD